MILKFQKDYLEAKQKEMDEKTRGKGKGKIPFIFIYKFSSLKDIT